MGLFSGGEEDVKSMKIGFFALVLGGGDCFLTRGLSPGRFKAARSLLFILTGFGLAFNFVDALALAILTMEGRVENYREVQLSAATINQVIESQEFSDANPKRQLVKWK